MKVGQSYFTSCLYPKVDLVLRRVSDGVPAKVNIRTVSYSK